MPELESSIEKKLIEKLCYGESQWTYRPELNNEEALWANFRHILEQNNKARLNDIPLSFSHGLWSVNFLLLVRHKNRPPMIVFILP